MRSPMPGSRVYRLTSFGLGRTRLDGLRPIRGEGGSIRNACSQQATQWQRDGNASSRVTKFVTSDAARGTHVTKRGHDGAVNGHLGSLDVGNQWKRVRGSGSADCASPIDREWCRATHDARHPRRRHRGPARRSGLNPVSHASTPDREPPESGRHRTKSAAATKQIRRDTDRMGAMQLRSRSPVRSAPRVRAARSARRESRFPLR